LRSGASLVRLENLGALCFGRPCRPSAGLATRVRSAARRAQAAFPCPSSAHPAERPPSPVSWDRLVAPVMFSASELHRVRRSLLRFRAGTSPVVGFLPSSRRPCGLRLGRACPGISSLHEAVPARRRPCLRAVGSAPLTGLRRLPRDSASTSRPCSSRRSLGFFGVTRLCRAVPPQVSSPGFAGPNGARLPGVRS